MESRVESILSIKTQTYHVCEWPEIVRNLPSFADMPSRYYCNMCSRSFRRSAELRRHTSTEHNDALERIARLEKALERLTGDKTGIPPSPPSSTNGHSVSPEPMHQYGSEEPLLDLATINAQFLFVDRAMNDVLIRLDCLERARKLGENTKCRCATPREKIIERRARSLAQRIEKSPREVPQQISSQESRMVALEMTLDRMTAGLRVALGRETAKKADFTAERPSWTPLSLHTGDVEGQEILPSDGNHHLRHSSKYNRNNPG
jgi:hypothetical protein